MMAFVLGACSRDEVIQRLHLRGHIFHLGVYYADRLFLD